jgi:hypothetical protein
VGTTQKTEARQQTSTDRRLPTDDRRQAVDNDDASPDGQPAVRWMSRSDAAAELQCTERTVDRRVEAGKLERRWAADGKVEIGVVSTDGRLPTDTDVSTDRRRTVDRASVSTDSQQTSPDGRRTVAVSTDRRLPTDAPRDTEWRADLLTQIDDMRERAERAEAGRAEDAAAHEDAVAQARVETGLLVEATKARVIDLERELTGRDSTIADLTARLADSDVAIVAKEGKAETLHEELRAAHVQAEANALEWARRADELSHRIADLVERQQDSESRIIELQPEAEKVPMLQAAVEEKDASLSERERELGNMRADIDAIASRPVTGPVFRLLTKGKLRR